MRILMLILYLFYLFGFVPAGDATDSIDATPFVDPLIGTRGGGHVFPGATLPYGMAKAVADTDSGENQGGFTSDESRIIGFSHMHDDGTGGSPSLGNFPLFVHPGCEGDIPSGCEFSASSRAVSRKNGSVQASPGYFAITTETNVRAEMTVSKRTALYRFSFPTSLGGRQALDSSSSPLIQLDLSDLPRSRDDAAVTVSPKSGRMSGFGHFHPSFGVGGYYLYFCADFKGAKVKNTGLWEKNKPLKNSGNTLNSTYGQAGAYVQFAKPHRNSILARVGVSFISEQKACKNAETEIPTFDFENTKQAASEAWKQKLSAVKIKPGGVGKKLQTVFWSGIYRTLISPQDYTGENPLWNSTEPYFDSFYCIWDSFRSIHPLITLLDPHAQSLMVRSLIDTYRHEGWLPDCRMSLCKGFTQGGSNADVVLADAYLKGLRKGIDWETGYKALIKDAEVEPSNWDVEGRGALEDWHNKGYIPLNPVDHNGTGSQARSISRTVEYAYNDFCIAELAKSMGKKADYKLYSERSGNWINLYQSTQTSTVNNVTFTGFLQPKLSDGKFGSQDPTLCSPYNFANGCYLGSGGHETYEGSCWLYTFFVPGDMASLIKTLGGADKFVERLDFLHENNLLNIGDEQAFLPVFQYHYAGRPALSAERAHFYIPSQFNTTVVGIPGNDDSGAMGSFSTLSMMGIFPNPGQNVYFITPPFFESVSITNPMTGKTATIRNKNFDPSYKAIYIQSATLNGKKYTKNWIDHSIFLKGGVLELTLGTKESSWGTADEDLPPSLSTTGMHL